MLEIAKSNSETSNNSIRLAVAMLAINIAKLVATDLTIPVIAIPFKLTTTTPLKRSACKAARDCATSNAS
jgi:phosphoribosylcarboxyaminoimidazole (NCAIR) mutase